jgi:hypothetical protein
MPQSRIIHITWVQIHEHFSGIDQRIPPFSCYVPGENRPYYDQTLLEFRLLDAASVPDTTGAWFDEARKKWNSLMREAIYTDRNFESFFGNPWTLKATIAKAKKAETVAQEELIEVAKHIYDVNNLQPLWDPYRGHYFERTPEQAQEALKALRK